MKGKIAMYPQCNLGGNKPYSEVMGGFLPALKDFYANPHKYRMEPFRIFGNLYYVGDQKVCMHLIDTGDGLILFDSGYRHATHLLMDSILRLGYQPKDVKYLIHSHGHFDHFGGGNEFRSLYGTKIFMSRVDTELVRERPDRALTHLSSVPEEAMCWPDVELEDGDVITLGNTSIKCVLAPGHTLGTMAFFFNVTDGEKTYRVGYMGGIGFLTVYKEFCREYGLPEDKCERMEESIKKVWDEPVDIVIGNHPYHNCTLEKRQWMLDHPGTNPFIDPTTWHILLTALEERRQSFMALGY